MSGGVNDDYGAGGRSSSMDDMSSGQRCQSVELVEWRSCEQVENGTPSTSPPYWDTDDDDDIGPKPSVLYGKFTWKIENFSQISKRELRSNAFEVGGYKWYILIYPQGCDVCNHLSLFLCVANHDKLLPGWSHFAQFTIAVVNKDPKKSKYSDTLHRFWKKEHDWGWKKFMELSKVLDGFIKEDTLVIKAQVQVIREKTHRPFRCLDCQYRRELVRVYLSNVEQICRRFVEERRGKLGKLIEDRVRWSSFRAFWLGVDKNARRCMSSDKTEAILKVVVKHFFIEKEVTSTLVMDSLYSGLKALECQSKNIKGKISSTDVEEMPAPMVCVEKDMFVLADDVLVLLERAAMEPMPPKEDKGSQSQNTNQNRTKDGSSGEEFNKDSIERDERRLTELGRRTVEIFVLAHIFSRIEVAYQEAVALKRQEELIREEEAAWQAEELKGKRGASEKENKKSKKSKAKQKRTSRKGKDKARDEKPDVILLEQEEKNQRRSPSVESQTEDCLIKPADNIIEKVEISEDISDVSDTGGDATETLRPDLEDVEATHINWDTDTSEIPASTEASSSEIPNEQVEKLNPSIVDDSSSTCSTDSVPSVGMNGQHKGNFLQTNKGTNSPSRGKYQRNRSTRNRTSHTHQHTNGLPSAAAAAEAVSSRDASDVCRAIAVESASVLTLKDHIQVLEQHIVGKEEEATPSQKKMGAKNEIDVDRPVKQITSEPSSVLASPVITPPSSLQQSVRLRESSSNSSQAEKSLPMVAKPFQAGSISKQEIQKSTTTARTSTAQVASPMSRPLSAPLIPGPRPIVPFVSTAQAAPSLSRSVSATGRLGSTEPLPSLHSYAPRSYRNAIIGKSSMGSSSSGVVPRPSTSQGSIYPQPATSFLPHSSTAPLQSSTSTDKISMRPGFGFRSMVPEASSSGNRWAEGSPVQEASSSNMLHASNLINDTSRLQIQDVALHRTEAVSGASVRQTQGTSLYEFPHLDLINYLFDEEQVIDKAAANGHNQHTMNRQYTFPGSLATTEASLPNGSAQFELPGQYYDDSMYRALYGSPNGLFDGRRDLVSPQLDPSAYTNGQMDGLLINHWSSSGADHAMHGVDPTDIHGYQYQFPDYSSLTRGFNGYTMYRPANGR